MRYNMSKDSDSSIERTDNLDDSEEKLDKSDESRENSELAVDEVYCTSCGETIKRETEICPDCGVRQIETDSDESDESGESLIPDARVYELQKRARKSPAVAVVLAIFLPPAAYWYVGRTGLAVINFLTLNFFLFGFIIVPIHTYKIVRDAQKELKRNGKSW